MIQTSAFADRSSEDNSLEQFLFLWSPFGTAVTSMILFGLLAGSNIEVAKLVPMPLLEQGSHGLHIAQPAWAALVLSLLTATILGMQRYMRVKGQADAPDFAAIASNPASADSILGPASGAHMLWAGTLGALVGVPLALATAPLSVLREYPALFAWNLSVIIFVCALFVRGIALTNLSARAMARLVTHELQIDLLRVDKLAVIGRRGARNALVWFICSAVVCLFFVVGNVDSTTVFILTVCAGMGLWIFLRPVEGASPDTSGKIRRVRADSECDR